MKRRHFVRVKAKRRTPIQVEEVGSSHTPTLSLQAPPLQDYEEEVARVWKTWECLAREKNNLRMLKERTVPPTSLPLLIALVVIKPCHAPCAEKPLEAEMHEEEAIRE